MFTFLSTPSTGLERAYDVWRFAADEATDALQTWQTGPRDARATTYEAYRAALDREEHAAQALAWHAR